MANFSNFRACALGYQGFLHVPQGLELPSLEVQFLCLACCLGVVCTLKNLRAIAGFPTIRLLPTVPHPFKDHPGTPTGPSLGGGSPFSPSFGPLPLQSPDLPDLSILMDHFPPVPPSSHLTVTVVNNLQDGNSSSSSLSSVHPLLSLHLPLSLPSSFPSKGLPGHPWVSTAYKSLWHQSTCSVGAKFKHSLQ